jgi:hypothetical protein
MKISRLPSLITESGYSARFQFEVLTVFVWVTDIFLAYGVVFRGHGPHFPTASGYLYTIPLVHLAPWFCALWVWKEISEAQSRGDISSSIERKAIILFVMRATYGSLVFIEMAFLLFYR